MKKIKSKSLIWLLPGFLMACTASGQKETIQKVPADAVSYTKNIVHDEFISEGVAVGDVNKDGQKDLIAGFYWFEAPDWQPHEIAPVEIYDYTKGYSHSFLNYMEDVNQDGWLDLIKFDFPGQGVYWYENPKGKNGYWTEQLIDSMACNESPMMADIDGDGRGDLVFGNEKTGYMQWFRPPAKGKLEWERILISETTTFGTNRFSHGLGHGDINGDGRKDIIIREGWWEAPEDPTQVPWTFHETSLGEPCSQMYAYDFDADGDNDVISASAHAFGIWWHEQIIAEDGSSTFKRHLIDSTFSQTHGAALTDINHDGLPDLVTGKRFFAHQGKDPGGRMPPVIYWLELRRDENNQPSWIKHLIDDDSGIGLQVVMDDLNGDGKMDIINANKKGVIYFLRD